MSSDPGTDFDTLGDIFAYRVWRRQHIKDIIIIIIIIIMAEISVILRGLATSNKGDAYGLKFTACQRTDPDEMLYIG